MIDMKQIGNTIRVARQQKKMLQKDLAEILSVTSNYISMIESGKVESLSLEILIRIAETLELSLDEMFSLKTQWLQISGEPEQTTELISKLMSDERAVRKRIEIIHPEVPSAGRKETQILIEIIRSEITPSDSITENP